MTLFEPDPGRGSAGWGGLDFQPLDYKTGKQINQPHYFLLVYYNRHFQVASQA